MWRGFVTLRMLHTCAMCSGEALDEESGRIFERERIGELFDEVSEKRFAPAALAADVTVTIS